ncbi:MAG: hypothetical protein DYG89_50020 [Caldilinea sp. CFX5]|nr:hypothetical protein [Caldilinea sp. CFX5]
MPPFYSQQLDGRSSLSGGPKINRLRNPGFEAGGTGWESYTQEETMHRHAPQPMKTTELPQLAQMKTLEESLESAAALLFSGQVQRQR